MHATAERRRAIFRPWVDFVLRIGVRRNHRHEIRGRRRRMGRWDEQLAVVLFWIFRRFVAACVGGRSSIVGADEDAVGVFVEAEVAVVVVVLVVASS